MRLAPRGQGRMHGQLLHERVESFGGGMDAFTRSTLLPPDASQYFENVNVLDNLEARTRPGAATLDAGPADPDSEIQGLIYYDTPTHEQLIAGSGAKLWRWEGSNWVEIAGWALNSGTLLLASAQGVDKALFSDGVAALRSWDGAALTALTTNTGVLGDPPVGATILVWHGGRMVASGVGSEPDTIWASALLDFGNGKWDHTKFKFRVGGGEGERIIGLLSLQDFWLAVIKENSVWLVNTIPEATSSAQWTIVKLSSGSGGVGRRALTVAGNDAFFMAREGVRSVRRMAAAAGQYELSPPISQAMQPYIDRINWTVAHLIAAHTYEHLVLFGIPLDAATSPTHTLVYNARLGRWTGVWTGWTPRCWETTRFGAVHRLVFGQQNGLVRQWTDFEDVEDDDTYTDDGTAIATKAWLRGMLFGQPINDKDAYDVELRFSKSNAIVTCTIVGDQDELRTWTHDLRTQGVSLPVNLPFDLASPRARTGRRGLRDLRRFNECFLKIESATGWWALKNATLRAQLKKVPTA